VTDRPKLEDAAHELGRLAARRQTKDAWWRNFWKAWFPWVVTEILIFEFTSIRPLSMLGVLVILVGAVLCAISFALLNRQSVRKLDA